MINPESNPDEIIKEVLSLLSKAATDKKHPMHFIIISSISGKIPEMRYVVWRNFDVMKLSGQIYTDFRSDKIEQLEKNPFAQLLFYDPTEKLQVKVNTEVLIHRDTAETQAIYQKLKGGHESYNTLEAPGAKHNSFEETTKMKYEFNPADFAVLETKFLSIEVLQLQSPHHIRLEYNFTKEKGDWLVP